MSPETEKEIKLHETAPDRAKMRQERKQRSKELALFLNMPSPPAYSQLFKNVVRN